MRHNILSLAIAAQLVSALAASAQTPLEKPPEPGPLRRFSVPPVQTATLANGLRIALIEKHSLPVISARIQVDAGAVREPAQKSGVAVLTANLLSEGTRDMTGAAIADSMAMLGAQFGTSGAFSGAFVTVTSLANVFEPAFALAAKTVTEPGSTRPTSPASGPRP